MFTFTFRHTLTNTIMAARSSSMKHAISDILKRYAGITAVQLQFISIN